MTDEPEEKQVYEWATMGERLKEIIFVFAIPLNAGQKIETIMKKKFTRLDCFR